MISQESCQRQLSRFACWQLQLTNLPSAKSAQSDKLPAITYQFDISRHLAHQ
jgi:hypothetical protein